jgi:hypothetical protein
MESGQVMDSAAAGEWGRIGVSNHFSVADVGYASDVRSSVRRLLWSGLGPWLIYREQISVFGNYIREKVHHSADRSIFALISVSQKPDIARKRRNDHAVAENAYLPEQTC